MSLNPTFQLHDIPDEILIQIFLKSLNPNFLLTNHYFYRFYNDDAVRAMYFLRLYGTKGVFSNSIIGHCWFTPKVIKILFKLGAQIDNDDYFIIRWCCKTGCLEIIEYLFELDKDFNIDINFEYSLFFKLACQYRQIHTAKKLIDLGIEYKDYLNILFCKVSNEQATRVMDFLLEHGADVNYENSRALREAAYFNNFPSLQYLLKKGANVHAFSESCLMSACHKGFYKIVKVLIDFGADINFNGGASLRFSASSGHFKIVDLLIKSKINLNSRNCGIKALRDSAKNGHLNIVRLLLKNNVPVSGLKDAALLCAVISGNYDIVSTLLEHGANVSSINGNILTEVFKRHHKDIMDLLYKYGLKK